MTKLNQITDEDLDSERKQGVHKRNEKLYNNVTTIMVISMWLLSIFVAIAVGHCFYLYFSFLNNPSSVDVGSIKTIETLATHAFAGIGGYAVHILKKTTGG